MTEHSDSKCEYGATRESDLDAESGFLYINEGGRCVYCRSHVTEELIESHLHNCPGRLEICNLCFSLVHLREMNSHDQSNCERYIAGRAFRMKEVRLLPLGLNLSSLKRLAPWIAVTFVIVFIACFSTYEAIQYMSTPVPENFHP
ncbi:hypothetical protein NDN08_003333 [Rhodosorus marinus]|uniref:TRAF-type domain-containing protein n=1 Tax=Rhodosorus marinus TaxID=101924 RepID=A0AAV8UXR9_9RHOD|nr:hypothetical protein NDN08_003333 [Rhodosorus marinus]